MWNINIDLIRPHDGPNWSLWGGGLGTLEINLFWPPLRSYINPRWHFYCTMQDLREWDLAVLKTLLHPPRFRVIFLLQSFKPEYLEVGWACNECWSNYQMWLCCSLHLASCPRHGLGMAQILLEITHVCLQLFMSKLSCWLCSILSHTKCCCWPKLYSSVWCTLHTFECDIMVPAMFLYGR